MRQVVVAVVKELESFPVPITTTDDNNATAADAAQAQQQRVAISQSSSPSPSLNQKLIRTFSLSLHGVTVELCSLGASILRFLVPSGEMVTTTTTTDRDDDDDKGHDDIVLGYSSPLDMWIQQNPNFFSVVVGRVANRIAKGEFRLIAPPQEDGPVYKLEINNGPNHLHGGKQGFSHCIWDAEIVNDDSSSSSSASPAVRFSLLSQDGDQGYPGSVRISATYSLRRSTDNNNNNNNNNSCSSSNSNSNQSVKLCLDMQATLLGDKPTPINMAQHSYFNLSRHDDPVGILDHRLHMPNCLAYTPLDEMSIPTRQVRPVAQDRAMNWCSQSRLLRVALVEYGVAHCGLSPEQAMANTKRSRITPYTATGPDGKSLPYGFDHNYVVTTPVENAGLVTVAVLEHTPSKRRLTVRSNAPGVQLYSGNFLDGTTRGKNGTSYGQWQGLCLETQHFPNSISVDSEMHAEFAKGACRILTPTDSQYHHSVEYILDYNVQQQSLLDHECNDVHSSSKKNNESIGSIEQFRGSDSNGRIYTSVQEMWREQGVVAAESSSSLGGRESWYKRAAKHYEENCEATLDGVLGGFANISDIDLAGSRKFMRDLQVLRPSLTLSSGMACECGAGIGRVSKGLLLPMGVARSDLVESSSRLLHAAPEYLGDELAAKCRFFCVGLQDWEPKQSSYCIIWIQWVLCYLTDEDAVAFLQRCGDALVDGGVIVLKENTCTDEDFVLDADDASVTRSVRYWKNLCTQAGLQIVYEKMQDDFPDAVFPVPMIALEKRKRP